MYVHTHMPVSVGFTLGTCGWLPRERRRMQRSRRRRRRRGTRRGDGLRYRRHILDKKGAAVIREACNLEYLQAAASAC
jgi:hypothetical protein